MDEIFLNAAEYSHTGIPEKDGIELAKQLLVDLPKSDKVSIDVTKCKPGLIITLYINSLLQTLHDSDPALVKKAKTIHWKTRTQFTLDNINRMMRKFKPNEEAN